MKSVKMFGKKIPILAVFLAMLLLVGTAAIAVPVNADEQIVTGSTYIGYSVTATVAFGPVEASTTATELDVITAGGAGNTITVTGVAVTGTPITDALEELSYVDGTNPPTSGTPMPIFDEDVPVGSWTAITLGAGEQLSMEAVTGTVAGSWGTITITITVGP